MSFENISAVSGNASITPSPTRDGFADMFKHARLNGPSTNLDAGTAGTTSMASGDNSLGAGTGAAQPELMSVTLRRVHPAAGKDNQAGTGVTKSGGSGASPFLPYVPPIQTQDDQGRTIPKYRMGAGQRILGTLANFASGFAGRGGSPVYVGPGALNNRYYHDEAYREQQNQDVAQRNADQYRNAIDYRTVGQNPVTGKWIGKTYGGEIREIETPPWAAPGETGPQPKNQDTPAMRPRFQPVSMPGFGSSFPQTEARARFASLRNPDRSQPNFPFTAKHGETNQRIGSHDGKTWQFIDEPDQPTSA